MKDKFCKFFNPNPEGNEDAGDCVIRALCAVTGLSWYEVYDKCCEIFTKPYLVDRCIENNSYRPRITKLKDFLQEVRGVFKNE